MKKPYPKYKSTNIQWIGNIPEHWEARKLSRSIEKIGSGATPKSGKDEYHKDGDINWLLTGDLNDSFITQTSKKITKKALEDYSALKLYESGSVVMAMYGATIGKLGILKINTTTNQACCVMSDGNYFANKFLYYHLLANRNDIVNLSIGGGQPNISQEIIKSLKLACPDLEEQKQIINFLDNKASEIDQAVTDKEQLLEFYEEEKKAIINNAVTKGLDTNVNLKDTGIEWLGNVPDQWDVKKLKYLTQIQGRIGFKGYSKSDLVTEGEGALTIGAKHINNNNELDLSNPEYLSWDKYLESPEIFVNQNDLLVTQRGTLGKVVLINQNIGEATINPSMLILREVKCNRKFLFNVLSSAVYTMWIENISSGTAVPMISQEQLKNFQIALPKNSDEQSQIVDFIEKETLRINSKKELVQKEIELLKEYKQALIYEAVTGKIDVRNN